MYAYKQNDLCKEKSCSYMKGVVGKNREIGVKLKFIRYCTGESIMIITHRCFVSISELV